MTPAEPDIPPSVDPDPPVTTPDPPVVTPEPDTALCRSPDYFTYEAHASDQATIDALAGCRYISSLSVLAPLDRRPANAVRRAVPSKPVLARPRGR